MFSFESKLSGLRNIVALIFEHKMLLSKVIGDIYSSIGISSLSEFESYLLQNNIDIERVKEKISIEIAWNNLIVNIYENEIEINQNAMYKELEKIEKKKVDNLLLSEIVFTINDKKELKSKYEEIEKSINEIGFEETARIYSLSDSKKSGGNLGWINSQNATISVPSSLNGSIIRAQIKAVDVVGNSDYSTTSWVNTNGSLPYSVISVLTNSYGNTISSNASFSLTPVGYQANASWELFVNNQSESSGSTTSQIVINEQFSDGDLIRIEINTTDYLSNYSIYNWTFDVDSLAYTTSETVYW